MSGFGGWSMTEICFNYIREILPSGKTILELGSGWTTGELAKHYKMYSIESESNWIERYDSIYIHAPIKIYGTESWWDDKPFKAPEDISHEDGTDKQKGWFNPEIVKNNLPEHYDLIIVDGPNGIYGRGGFYKYLDWFKTDVPIVIDDVNRKPEGELIKLVSKKLGREYKILSDNITGVIL